MWPCYSSICYRCSKDWSIVITPNRGIKETSCCPGFIIIVIIMCFTCFRFSLDRFHQLFVSASFLLQLIPCMCLKGVPAFGCWAGCRLQWPSGGLCHWNRGRCRSEGDCSATPSLCWYDPDPYLRWGPGSVRTHCGHLPLHKNSINVSSSFHHPATIKRIIVLIVGDLGRKLIVYPEDKKKMSEDLLKQWFHFVGWLAQ